MSVISALTLNPVVTKFLSATEGKDMLGVAIRDTMVNNAVSEADKKRDHYHGEEMKRNLWFTTAVWGFGVQAFNAMYDKTAEAMGRPLTNLNAQIIQKPAFAQEAAQWSEQAANASSKAVQHWGEQVGDILKAGGKTLTGEQAAAIYDKWGMGRVLVAGVVPALIVGPIFPPINRHVTKIMMARDMAAKEDIPYATAWERVQAAHAKAKASKAAAHPKDNRALATAAAVGAGALGLAGLTNAPLAAMGQSAIRTMNQNEVLTNLLGVDSVITGGRIMSGDTPAEKKEWLIQEAMLIAMVYFGAPWLNDALKDGLGKVSTDFAPYAGLKFETLEKLHKQFGKEPDALPKFQGKLLESAQELGIDLTGTDSKAVAQHLLDNSDKLLAGIQQQLAPGQYQPGKNLIVDLVVEAEKMPVLRERMGDAMAERGLSGLLHRKVIGYNPTQSAARATSLEAPRLNPVQALKNAVGLFDGDTGVTRKLANGQHVGNSETIEGLIHNGWQLSQHALKEGGTESMEKLLTHTNLLKAGALGVALGVNYAVLGVLSPMLRHASTRQMTGSDRVDWLGDMKPDIKGDFKAVVSKENKGQPGATLHEAALSKTTMSPVISPLQPASGMAALNRISTAYVPPLPGMQTVTANNANNPFVMPSVTAGL